MKVEPVKNIKEFIAGVDECRKEYWDANYDYKEYEPLKATKGKRYIKLIGDGSVWGFVCMTDGMVKGSYVKKGDLLKAASWNSPAAHSRGNIFEGTAKFNYYGPNYL